MIRDRRDSKILLSDLAPPQRGVKQSRFLLSLLFVIILISVSSYLYFSDHAWGAWGDDSAGYIFLAGRLWQKQPLIWQDELVEKGYQFFGNYKLSQFLLPTHYELINPNGTIASKYPLGLSVLMFLSAKIFRTDLAFYYVIPFFAVVNLVLVYLIFITLWQRQGLAFFTALILGISELYYEQAITQPMREIPSITFFLLTTYLLILYFRREKWWLLILAGLSFGYAANIRETMISLVPAITALFLWQKQWLKRGIIFSLFTLLALGLTFWNSYQISKNNLPFRPHDQDVVVTSNISHLRSISLQNVFNNQGRFLPGEGSLPHFWQVMNNFSPWSVFMATVVLGLIFLWQQNRRFGWFFLLWIIGVLGFFSLWINPYPRYILPIYPALAILGVLGIYFLIMKIIPLLFKHKILISLLVIVPLFLTYQNTFAWIKENLSKEVVWDRAISFDDLNQLKAIGRQLSGKILLIDGKHRFGLSETYMAHTGNQAIKFPSEERLLKDGTRIVAFFNQLIKEGKEFYFWQDLKTAEATMQFMNDNFNLTQKYQYQFNLTPQVTIYELTAKN